MNAVRFLAPARREFLAEVAYYEGRERGLGARFTSAVEEATKRALTFPLAGSPTMENIRRVYVKSFPFSVIYRQDSDCVVVVAVAHHSRRPDYWQNRIQDGEP